MKKIVSLTLLMALVGCQSTPESIVKTFDSPCDGQALNTNRDSSSPIVRVAPKYPIEAARNRIEGYVKLTFDITETGRVDKIHVKESFPETIFNYEAERALSKWLYKPNVVDGVAVASKCNSIQLDFKVY